MNAFAAPTQTDYAWYMNASRIDAKKTSRSVRWFLSGLASLAAVTRPLTLPSEPHDALNALRSDFERLGGDMRIAIARFAKH